MRKRNELHLVVNGRIPSKKNSRNLFVRGGRLMNIPSKDYADWHKTSSLQILEFKNHTIENVDFIELEFYAPDRRGADLTNKAESIMDLLVDNGILEDDNWWIVNKLTLSLKGLSKLDPRCEIFIHGKKNGQLKTK